MQWKSYSILFFSVVLFSACEFKNATVSIETDIDSALVVIDNEEVGFAPIKHLLSAGKHHLKVMAPGTPDAVYVDTIVLQKNSNSVIKVALALQMLFSSQQMVYVEGGSFLMGCSEEQSKVCEDDEKPLHRVMVNSFYISKYEVTQAQWRAVMKTDPPQLYIKGCADCPVERVSWYEAQAFISTLNNLVGRSYRLPTEAEWEFAARGGHQSRGYFYSGGNVIDRVAWYKGNSQSKSIPVGLKAPNELGIYDMSGNVWEWCYDWYDSTHYSTPHNGVIDLGSPNGVYRVLRGGSRLIDPHYSRISNRSKMIPGYSYSNFGFRLVIDSLSKN